MAKPLWKTLLNLAIEAEEYGLSCEECYNLMDQYADMLNSGLEPSEVMLLVKQHLSHCPDCDELFQTMLLVVQEASHNTSAARS